MTPESKPQGSEQPKACPRCKGKRVEPDLHSQACTLCGGEGKLWCAMCGTWGDHRSGGCPELTPIPNPSADEEVERLAVKMAADCYQRLAIYRPGILTEVQTTLKDFAALIRQQHNAELAKVRGELADYERSTQVNFDLQKRYNALQGDLATAEMERDEAERVIMATRNMAIEAMNRIRALIGASPNDPRPCETLVSELIESLRSQLQTAMEERDELKGKVDKLVKLSEWQEQTAEKLVAHGRKLEEDFHSANDTVIDQTGRILALQSHARELGQATKNLIWTASKLWEDVSPIKSGGAFTVTHPMIEEAKAALSSQPDLGLVEEVVEGINYAQDALRRFDGAGAWPEYLPKELLTPAPNYLHVYAKLNRILSRLSTSRETERKTK